MKKKLVCILIFLFVGVGICKATRPVEATEEVNPINYTIDNKIDYTKAITDKLEDIDKREITQINLRYKFTLKGKYKNKYLKNNNIVEVFAIGVYKFNSVYSILLNEDLYRINLNLETSIIESEISIEEDKGSLVFWDNKLTLDEAEAIRQEVKDDLIKEMNSQENLKAVKERAEHLLGDKENYKVEVNWVR